MTRPAERAHKSRCRWVSDVEVPGGRFLVPGCWSRALDPRAECHCREPEIERAVSSCPHCGKALPHD
jgi:hypothetical protein